MLHGYTSSPGDIETSSGWTDYVASADAVVAYPQGQPLSGHAGFGWTTGSARFSNAGSDDVAFILEIVDSLVAQYCVDPARVVLTGESNGAALVVRTACDPRSAGHFILVAPVIPAIDEGVTGHCGEGPAVPLVAIASKLDRTVPYDGHYASGVVPLDAQEKWFLRVARGLNGCDTDQVRRAALHDGERIVPAACAAPTELVAVSDGHHTWPGGPSGTAGLQPGSFDAKAYVWSAAFG
jgi:polyhydroxybutyrate depolymerase